MIVEGQGMGFWTRVRLPSGPSGTPLIGVPVFLLFLKLIYVKGIQGWELVRVDSEDFLG